MAYLFELIRPCYTCGAPATHVVEDDRRRPVHIYCHKHAGSGLAVQDAIERALRKGVRQKN